MGSQVDAVQCSASALHQHSSWLVQLTQHLAVRSWHPDVPPPEPLLLVLEAACRQASRLEGQFSGWSNARVKEQLCNATSWRRQLAAAKAVRQR